MRSEIREKPREGDPGEAEARRLAGERAQQERTLPRNGVEAPGMPHPGRGAAGCSLCCHQPMASPRNRRPPTQAPVTVNHTRPTLRSSPSAQLPAPQGTQFSVEAQSAGGRHANSLKAGPQPWALRPAPGLGLPEFCQNLKGPSQEASRPGLPEAGHHRPGMMGAHRHLRVCRDEPCQRIRIRALKASPHLS